MDKRLSLSNDNQLTNSMICERHVISTQQLMYDIHWLIQLKTSRVLIKTNFMSGVNNYIIIMPHVVYIIASIKFSTAGV